MRPKNKYQRRMIDKNKKILSYNRGCNEYYNGKHIQFLTKNPQSDYSFYSYQEDNPFYINYNLPLNCHYAVRTKFYGNSNNKKGYKKISNKRIRHNDQCGNGSNYRKVFDLWWALY